MASWLALGFDNHSYHRVFRFRLIVIKGTKFREWCDFGLTLVAMLLVTVSMPGNQASNNQFLTLHFIEVVFKKLGVVKSEVFMSYFCSHWWALVKVGSNVYQAWTRSQTSILEESRIASSRCYWWWRRKTMTLPLMEIFNQTARRALLALFLLSMAEGRASSTNSATDQIPRLCSR